MTTYTLNVKFYEGNRQRIIVPHRFYQQFKAVQFFRYGPNQTHVGCLTHHRDPSTIYISSQLKTKLNMAKHTSVTVEMDSNTCKIILTLGVFIAGFNVDGLPLGPRTTVYEWMSKAGEELGFRTVFFGYQHMLKEPNKIFGYHMDQNKWKQSYHEIPPVIYDRIPNRKIEHHPTVIETKRHLKENAIIFNQGFFNKWEIYERLMKSDTCSFLLPETILHPSKQKINVLLNHHPIYIKPIHGSRGNGIIKCGKLDTGEIESHFYYNDKAQLNRYAHMDAFYSQLFPNGTRGYVAQREVSLVKKGDRTIDFRVHVNKNHRNTWEVTVVCAKFSGKGSLTTHVKRGGTIHVLEEMFEPDETKRVERKLSQAALLLSAEIERTMNHPIGEIGFDFGVDTEGKVWLFEANSKPGFSIFDHWEFKKEANRILSYPFQYAFYLYNQQKNNLI
ncbi:YheC/YheD family protein [Aquibacillus sp. 3ASR75-11]|uniref:YheC/YheD family protein n=1 Tax=Terrihalobacillus insolitus TaxID=2950438 RepID=A0A9X3WU71_9BACI|nr:YheC/YheD family protein [Terrihalobacillus insolitus]MDC3413545.1 YheC/YheD family protein [Terrihalobacillus insolitus]MDC3424698.1 YheC/YheD family protein [Terrihalobacillus insolitus]